MEARYAGVVLTGPTTPEHLTEAVQFRSRRMVDQVPLVNSAVMKALPLGNRSRPIRVLYRRAFDSYVEAIAAAVRLDAQLPDQGQLTFYEAGVDGTVTIAFPDACVVETVPVRDGVGYSVAIDFVCSRPPAIVEGPAPPAVEATLATWGAAALSALGTRTLLEPQLVS